MEDTLREIEKKFDIATGGGRLNPYFLEDTLRDRLATEEEKQKLLS